MGDDVWNITQHKEPKMLVMLYPFSSNRQTNVATPADRPATSQLPLSLPINLINSSLFASITWREGNVSIVATLTAP